MYLGNTLEEKQASMDVLCKRAKKVGRFFQVTFGILYGLLMLYTIFAVADTEIPKS